MRAPPLARMAAVAAPRPDAEPVTTAHKPSFDIPIFLLLIFRSGPRSTITLSRMPANPPNSIGRNSWLRCHCRMPALQAALRRQVLVLAVAFPHHAVQKTIALKDRTWARRTAGREGQFK